MPRSAAGGAAAELNGTPYHIGGINFSDGLLTNVVRHMPATLGVAPSSRSWTGGYQVVITGTNLCDGVDVTNVILCGVSVASIASQSATQIVVMAGAPGIGDVRVFSASFGEAVKSNAFEYLKENQTLVTFRPTNGSVFVQNEVVGLSVLASSGLPVSFDTNSGPGVISGGTNLAFTGHGLVTIVAFQPGNAWWNPAPEKTNKYTILGLFPVAIESPYGATVPPAYTMSSRAR